MRGVSAAIPAVLSLSVVSLCLGLACATRPQISVSPDEDFGRYRTWDWLPAARRVEAPGLYGAGLQRDLGRLVARELRRRGFERSRGGGDLRIGAVLRVRREVTTVLETGAVQQLASLHNTPNFQVQAAAEREVTRERSVLLVVAVDPRSGRIVWQGTLEGSFRGKLPPHLERTVADLLTHFPAAGPARGTPPPVGDPSRGPSEYTVSPSPSLPDV
jgi:hypothetical protein